MTVHSRLGCGLKEKMYQEALELEIAARGLGVRAQHPVEVFDQGVAIGLYYLDLLVQDQVVVEIKAVPGMLTNEHLAQVISYLVVTNCPVGLLINFGRRRLEFRRILRPRSITNHVSRRYLRKYPPNP